MINFKEFSDFEWFTFTADNYVIHILYTKSDGGALLEGKNQSHSLGGQYSADLHKANSTVGQEHIHVYAKNNQLFAMNQDGSAHDRSHGTRIPNKVAQAIIQKFEGFKLPHNNFIEYAPAKIKIAFGKQLLHE
jgi:hypothetical protein